MKEEAHQRNTLHSFLGDDDISEPMENENDSSGLDDNSEDEGSVTRNIDYKSKYSELKRKVKILVYENVYFQNNLRTSQRRLLKITRDCSFLLDRLLIYERPELSSSDNDGTDSSDNSSRLEPIAKRRKAESLASMPLKTSPAQLKRNKKNPKKPHQIPVQERLLPSTSNRSVLATMPLVHLKTSEISQSTSNSGLTRSSHCDVASQEGQLSKEEIERHLQSRQKLPEVVPEGELPTEMFNNSLSSDSNDNLDETPPGALTEDCPTEDFNPITV